ncbi:hypothetical protein FGLOB1_7858 [Fusarium globosum]|uniref:Uncharacterized protein n=1 Tax=Fusarium globosum TaxID=78864 RepID=A0A8H6D601_9HYPO|nr:hypothetical protein FGLOB1_7858 [Fusarium globosum]
MTFQKLTSVEDAGQEIIEADSQHIKTVGTIQVVAGVAKLVARPKAPRFEDGKRHEPICFSRNKLVLNCVEQGHGTSYRKIDDALDSVTLLHRVSQPLGHLLFFYRPHDVLDAKGILNPNFVNNDTHGMRLSTQDGRVSVMSDGTPVIDLTRCP